MRDDAHVYYRVDGQRYCWTSDSLVPSIRTAAMVAYLDTWFDRDMTKAGRTFEPLYSRMPEVDHAARS